VRSISPSRYREREGEIVDRAHLSSFLRTAFRHLRRLRDNDDIDLELPIVYAVAGAHTRVPRQRFGELFLALEALRSIYLEHKSKTFLLPDKTFKRVQAQLRDLLGNSLRAEAVHSRLVRDQMTEKLAELNRPPFWRGVESLMGRLRVDWQDLYPEPVPERPTFLKMRNLLFHTHQRLKDEDVIKEAVRLEAVVQRIILRWLGWEDLWMAPSPWMRHFVAGKSLPEKHRLHGRRRLQKQRRR
jgi:hypothetical protein